MFNLKKLIKFKSKSMKLKDIVNSIEAINALMALKLPVVSSYKLSVFVSKIQPELTAFNEKRSELVKEFGAPKLDDAGKETDQFTFTTEKGKEFNDKQNELLEQDVNVEIPEIKIADLGNVEIEPNKLIVLAWLIKE
jgi:hypothetical protein